MPSGTNGSWKRALVAAYTRSQCRSMVLPIPTAGPPTAATIGFARLGSTLNSSTTGGSAPAGLLHRDDDRPLVPLRMLDADHRRLGDRRVRHRDALEVDRADPLAARLDHVLRAVGDLQDSVRVDGRHVAGREPLRAVLVRLQ